MLDKNHASNIPAQNKKLNLLIVQLQTYLEALFDDEAEEVKDECEKVIEEMISKNQKTARFEFDEV